jgi:uncharacterized protein YqiB (DUF1249 family)
MYKLLFFLHKTEDKNILEHFTSITLNYLNQISDNEIKIAEIDSSLMLESKYSHFCELIAASKEQMAERMSSATGKKLTKDLSDLHKYITVISVEYGDKA